MALNKLFIHFQTKSAFNEQKENISDTSIAFIKETGEIYTHDKLYGSISVASTTANGLMPKEHYSIIDKESNNLFVTELSNNVSTTADKVYIQYKSRYFGDDLKHDNICNILSATSTNAGVMSATDKRKLDSLSNYTLPTANSSTLGGIKIGSGLNIDSNGTVSVNNKLYILVNSLESVTTPDANKIYLVLNSSSTSETNSFTEYVWITSDTGGKWEKLGEASATVDLANYYTKTEIDNKLSPINNSITELDSNKVDKQDGKGLSTNDFTDSYKSYLDVLGTRSFGNSISYTSSDNEPDILKINLRGMTGIANDTKTLSSITIPLATTSKCGLMSMKDKYIVNHALIEVPYATPEVTGGVTAKIGDLDDMVNLNGSQPTVTYNYQRKLFMLEVDRNMLNNAFIPIPVPDVATTAKNGLLSKEDKIKLDSIETGANKYVLPEAGNNVLGGIKARPGNAGQIVSTINTKFINQKEVCGGFTYHTGMEQVYPTYHQVLEATIEKYGLMSPEDKVKLNNINVPDFAVDLSDYAKKTDIRYPWLEIDMQDDLYNGIANLNPGERFELVPQSTGINPNEDLSKYCGLRLHDTYDNVWYLPWAYILDDRSEYDTCPFMFNGKTLRAEVISASVWFINNDPDLSDYAKKTDVETTLSGMVKIQKLTQEEYDALKTKDENVLYAIIEPATAG